MEESANDGEIFQVAVIVGGIGELHLERTPKGLEEGVARAPISASAVMLLERTDLVCARHAAGAVRGRSFRGQF